MKFEFCKNEGLVSFFYISIFELFHNYIQTSQPFDKLVNLKTATDWFDLNKSTIAEYENITEKAERYKEDQE